MVTHPIHVTRDGYRGSNPAKKAKAAQTNQMATALERHINAALEAQERPIQEYSYHVIARETDVPYEVVRRLCFAIDCGHNGFTAIKRGMTYAQALDLLDREPSSAGRAG